MLFQIGTLTVQALKTPVSRLSKNSSTEYAQHAVLGGPEWIEYVREGPTTWDMTCTLLPLALGGADEWQTLEEIRQSNRAQEFMRGDGLFMGWVVVQSVSADDELLSRNGVPAKRTARIRLLKTQTPVAASHSVMQFLRLL